MMHEAITRMNDYIEYIYQEIELSRWREQLCSAKKIDNDLYNEAQLEGRRCD